MERVNEETIRPVRNRLTSIGNGVTDDMYEGNIHLNTTKRCTLFLLLQLEIE